MKYKYLIILLFFSITLLTSCGSDDYDIEYQVTSRINIIPAKIVYIDSKQSEQTLLDVSLPWNYNFKAEEGDLLKITTYLFNTGNNVMIGKDTMHVKILLNGSSFKEVSGVIINGSMEELSISTAVPK
jgi:hypothetical protein